MSVYINVNEEIRESRCEKCEGGKKVEKVRKHFYWKQKCSKRDSKGLQKSKQVIHIFFFTPSSIRPLSDWNS